MNQKTFRNKGKNIKEMVFLSKEAFPDRDAFAIKEKGQIEHISFFQLYKDIQNVGTEILNAGFGGERVGIIGTNSYRWFNVFLAVVNSGGTAVPFDKGLTPEELRNCINRSKIKALFYDDVHEDMVKSSISGLESTIKTYKMNGQGEVISQMRLEGEERIRLGDKGFEKVEISPNDLAVILFTSGTTSNSKAVMLTHANIMSNIFAMQNFEQFYGTDVNMAFLPFHHSFGLVGVLVFMASGASSVFCDGLKYVSKNMKEYGVTVFVGVPLIVESMYKKIQKKIQKDGLEAKVNKALKLSAILSKLRIDVRRKLFSKIIDGLGGKLRLIIVGAAPLNRETSIGLNSYGISVIQGYGLTETSPVVAAERPWDLEAGSVGKPLPGISVVINNPDENGIGEIILKGPNIMAGYLDQPEETGAVVKDGWFYTGDLGYFSPRGNIIITGRKKNVIVMKNGKNIFPEEIESHIERLPYASEVMVFVREKHNELVLWAKIVYKEDYYKEEFTAKGKSFDDFAQRVKEDIAEINDTMPKYKHINHFILTTEEMIKTTTQKVKRNLEIEKISKQRDSEVWYNV